MSEILVVEDNVSLAASYCSDLSQSGFNVHSADTIEAALQILETHHSILVVLTDYRLRDGDGLSLVTLFRMRNPNRSWVEFVLVTGHGTLEIAQLAIHAEIRQFLTKPVAPPVLTRAIQTAAESAQSRQRTMMARDTLSNNLSDILDAVSSLIPTNKVIQTNGKEVAPDYRSLASNLLALEMRRHAILTTIGISEREWIVLIQVYNTIINHKFITLKSAAYDLSLPLSTLIRIVNELCERGYLNRRVDPLDGRRSFIELKTKGGSAVEAVIKSDYTINPK